MPPLSGRIVIADANTPTPLSEGGSTIVAECEVQADTANSASIFIGDSRVRSASKNGFMVRPGDKYDIGRDDLSTWYISGTKGDAVSFCARIDL